MKLRVRQLKGISKSIGLIGKKEVYPVMLTTRFGIHTFGLRFPIDVLILDENNKVACFRKNLRTNRIFLWNPKFEKVIELPAGTVNSKRIKVGDTLNLETFN